MLATKNVFPPSFLRASSTATNMSAKRYASSFLASITTATFFPAFSASAICLHTWSLVGLTAGDRYVLAAMPLCLSSSVAALRRAV